MNRPIAIAVAAVLLAAVTTGIYFNMTRGVPVQTATVERGDIREFIDERGKTRLPVTHLITMPFTGRVQRIDLPEGTPVKAGQVVALVSPADVAAEVEEARAVVERLQAAIAQNDDSTVEEVIYLQARQLEVSMQRTAEAAEERKLAGQERLDFAQKALARAEELFREGAMSQEERDQAKVDLVESQVNYRTDVLVWQAMQAIEAATSFLPQMVRDVIERKQLARAVLEKEKLEAEVRLRQAELRRERSEMKSPVDGVVLERRIIDEQYLAGGTVLLAIGRLEDLEVEAEILSQDVVRIEEGDPVEIYGPAIGEGLGEGVAGVVQRIYPGGFTKVSSLGVEQQRVKVIVRFEQGVLPSLLERDLGVEYRVRTRVFTESRQDTLVLPRTAIFRGADGGWRVFAIRHRRARLKPVAVGLMNDSRIEILEGLEQGDAVVLAPESTLQDGTWVRQTGQPD